MASQSENLKSADEAKPVEEQEITENSWTTDVKQTATASSEPSSSTSSRPEPVRIDGFRVPYLDNMSNPWAYYSTVLGPDYFASLNGGRPDPTAFIPPSVPRFFHPASLPGFVQVPSLIGQQRQQGGVFVVPLLPVMGPIAVLPAGGLILVSLSVSNFGVEGSTEGVGSTTARSSDAERPMPDDAREDPAGEVPAGQGLRPRHAAPQRAGQVQRVDAQRLIVRRFQVGFRLDLLLIMKLAVVVFVFNQDGSRDRLLLLLFLAGLVYMYQTGALTPLLQWISQSAQRAMMPPQPPVQAAHGQQARPDMQGRLGGGNAQNERGAAGPAPAEAGGGPVPRAAAGGIAEEHVAELPAQGANWWGFLKEVQMLVVGFVTSLLPGFQHVD